MGQAKGGPSGSQGAFDVGREWKMGRGDKIETRGHVVGFREEIQRAVSKGKDFFFRWFNNATDADAAFVRGNWDFAFHIANPVSPFLKEPENKVALEIGYGGGRLLASACRFFKSVIGVDIHEQSGVVSDELKKRGITNLQLLQADGKSITLEDGSVDFVYSFIVLQHVEKIAVFNRYLEESYRVLKPDGLALLYFGRRSLFSLGKNSVCLYLLDRLMEWSGLKGTYAELPAAVNDINLFVSLPYAKRLARRIGFSVLSEFVSRKNVPDGLHLYGAQHGLVLKKK